LHVFNPVITSVAGGLTKMLLLPDPDYHFYSYQIYIYNTSGKISHGLFVSFIYGSNLGV
jgi:hypothetical protein